MNRERTETMRGAIEDAAAQLIRIRRTDKRDALFALTGSYRGNLRDAAGTADESYWRAMLAIAEELLVAQGQPSLMESSYE